MTRKQRRLTLIAAAGAVLAIALGLALFVLRDSIVFFYAPSEMAEKGLKAGARFRLGGLVKQGSVTRGENQTVSFVVHDPNREVAVRYTGLLPDLFREGQGIVAEGVLQSDGSFKADSVLAKHDERYMPREVADALKKQGVWQGDKKAASQ
jgi:cytochrome c-type biogenesis protein CcmE